MTEIKKDELPIGYKMCKETEDGDISEWGYCEICDRPLTEDEAEWLMERDMDEILCAKCRPKGHYESSGYLWDYGEVPKCHYCGEQATLSTGVSGIHICDKEECAKEHAHSEFDPIEWEEDE